MSEDPCLKVDEKVTTLKSGNGLLTLIKSEAAQVITKYFSSVLVQGEDNSTFARAHNPRYAISDDDITQHIQFTTSAVLEKLQQLHIDKSPGPDGIHLVILHHCICTIIILLIKICKFQFSLAMQKKLNQIL